MMAEHYRVKMKRGDSEIEVEATDKAYVDAKLAECLSLLADVPPKGPSFGAVGPTPKRSSLPEFAREINPKSGAEHVVTIAYFKEKYDKTPELKTRDIKEGFKALKHRCTNPSQAIAQAKTRGFLIDGDSKRSFRLSNTGEKWIEERLQSREGEG